MNEQKIRIKQYEQAADEKVSLGGIRWERKWDVCVQCDSREEAERVRAALTMKHEPTTNSVLMDAYHAMQAKKKAAQPEQSPLDRMAENARELGLDYEPVEEPVEIRLGPLEPAPRREWVGLTGEELDLIARTAADLYDAALKSEAKLKEKNGRVNSFLRRLLDPEDLGHAVSHEVRQKVRELL